MKILLETSLSSLLLMLNHHTCTCSPNSSFYRVDFICCWFWKFKLEISVIRINGLYNVKEAGLQSIKSMASFTDLILHEYGGWEKFPNHTEETSVLERYTKASTLTLRGEKRERTLRKEIVPWRIQILDNLCKRQFLNYPLLKRSGFSKSRQPNCMILNQIKINFKY